MARIRTIKPEFWSSPGLPTDPWERLLFVAMWNWADDYGIGTANERELLAFAFPNDPQIDAADLRRMLASVRRAFGVEFYMVAGRPYYAIPSWEDHQKIDRRSARRNPGPDKAETWLYQDPHESPRVPAESPPISQGDAGVGKGTEDLGKGTEEEEPPYPPDLEPEPQRALARQTGSDKALARFGGIPGQPSPLARQVAIAYSDSGPVPIQPKLLRDVADQIDSLLQANIPTDAIVLGLDAWTTSDSFSPKQIPNYVHKANNGRRPNGVGKPTESALDYQAAAEQLLAKVSTK